MKLLTVIDLRKRLGFFSPDESEQEEQAYEADNWIVVVSLDQLKVGMIVDSVSEVLLVPKEAIEPPPAIVASANSACINGIAKLPGSSTSQARLATLLDLRKTLAVTEQPAAS